MNRHGSYASKIRQPGKTAQQWFNNSARHCHCRRYCFIFMVFIVTVFVLTSPAQNFKSASSTYVRLNGAVYLVIQGNFTNSGTYSAGSSSTTTFNSSGAKTMAGATTFNHLTKSGGGDFTLNNDVRVNGTLTLTSGNIILGSNNLTLGASASVSGSPSASNMVVASGAGEMRKEYSGTGSFTFPVGDNTGTVEYSPATLNFTSGTFFSAYAAVRVTDAKHPNNNSSTDYIDRYWTVSQSGITGLLCSTTFNYLDADVNGTESNFYCARWSGSAWQLLDAANTSTNELTGTVSAFGDFTGGENAALPVELTSFTARVVDRNVELRWRTATEVNSYGFEVERRSKNVGKNWEEIGFVPGQGTTNVPHVYRFIDRDLDDGAYYYRLKQVDRDGSRRLYPAVEAVITSAKSPALFPVYPNPFTGSTTVRYYMPEAMVHALRLVDVLGREVKLLSEGYGEKGMHTAVLNVTGLSAGTYLLRLETPERFVTQIVVLVP